jgi:hypothetical protein
MLRKGGGREERAEKRERDSGMVMVISGDIIYL